MARKEFVVLFQCRRTYVAYLAIRRVFFSTVGAIFHNGLESKRFLPGTSLHLCLVMYLSQTWMSNEYGWIFKECSLNLKVTFLSSVEALVSAPIDDKNVTNHLGTFNVGFPFFPSLPCLISSTNQSRVPIRIAVATVIKGKSRRRSSRY